MKKWLSDNLATILVGLFIVGIVFGLAREARADTQFELGPVFIGGDPANAGALFINETWDNKWVAGMGLISDAEYKGVNAGSTLLVHGQRLVYITDDFRLGLGVAYLNNEGVANGSGFNSSLSVEYHLGERWDLRWRHFSNAGSRRPNPGHDILTVVYNFR